MLLTGFERIDNFFPPCHPGEVATVTATAEFRDDISEVFPYLNAAIKGASFDSKSNSINFKYDGHGVTLHARKVVVTGSRDRAEAENVLGEIKDLINRNYENRENIEPSYRERGSLKVFDVYKLLPRTNCGQCGVPACMGFAAQLISEAVTIEACKPLFEEANQEKKEKLFALIEEAGYPLPAG